MAEYLKKLGKKVVDIGPLVDVFEAQEGEIQQIIGKTGNGKTTEATRRAWEYLKQGYVVYTTWRLILPETYDDRERFSKLFWRTLFFKKRFYSLNIRENWKFLDVTRPDLIEFVAGLTDCIVMLDEGQDIFDSRERIGKEQRMTLTRTRHMRKTLIIISQRAQAVEVTARANVTYFYKCVKTRAWYWPFIPYFKIYRTEEMDNQNFPIWEEPLSDWKAELWKSYFATQRIYKMFNSWYLRAGVLKSQEVRFDAYDLTLKEKLIAMWKYITVREERKTFTEPLKDYELNPRKVFEVYKVQKKEKVLSTTRRLTVKDDEVQLSNENASDIQGENKVRENKSIKKKRTTRVLKDTPDKIGSEQGEKRPVSLTI